MDNHNKKLIVANNNKQIQIYDLLNKIQNVLNTETLLPQFIYFAKNMEEIRKKWLEAELRVKELENKMNTERSIYQRKINELKIDIEIHHEKRLQAENKSDRLQNELDKLQKQFKMFKEVLSGDSGAKYGQFYSTNLNDLYEERLRLNTATLESHTDLHQIPSNLYTTDSNTNLLNNDQQRHQVLSTINLNQNLFNSNNNKNSKRLSNCNIEETGSIISDYTEDDIDLPSDELAEQEAKSKSKPPKRTVQRHSTSLTRGNNNANENETNANIRKRTRSKSNDKSQTKRISTGINNAITAITTLKIGENGQPTILTSEIKHENLDNNTEKANENRENNNDTSAIYMRQRARFRKKRPSREFLHRSIDDSDQNDDSSEIFWNQSDILIEDEEPSKPTQAQSNPTVHIMTPITEVRTPMNSNRIYSSIKKQINATPSSTLTPFKTISNLIPLAKRYKKSHMFKGQVILNSELCAHCDKRTRFGKMIMKCRECDMVVHNECKDLIQRPCYRVLNYPANGLISDYVGINEYPHIPPILQMIINEIEIRGLLKHEVGLYRVNGSDTQIKQLKEKLIKRHQMPDLRKISDVHVLCSFVKDFLNNLTEHLITYDSWYRFAKACDIQNELDRICTIKDAVQDLPEANRDTLAFLILHLQRISETAECKMPASNLARVFGPSIVGNSSAQLSPPDIINEIKIQHQIVENLIKIPSTFYMKFIEVNEHEQERLFKSCTKTPDIMRKSKTAVVLSSILGPAVNVQSSKI